jgi:hypothetical protein
MDWTTIRYNTTELIVCGVIIFTLFSWCIYLIIKIRKGWIKTVSIQNYMILSLFVAMIAQFLLFVQLGFQQNLIWSFFSDTLQYTVVFVVQMIINRVMKLFMPILKFKAEWIRWIKMFMIFSYVFLAMASTIVLHLIVGLKQRSEIIGLYYWGNSFLFICFIHSTFVRLILVSFLRQFIKQRKKQADAYAQQYKNLLAWITFSFVFQLLIISLFAVGAWGFQSISYFLVWLAVTGSHFDCIISIYVYQAMLQTTFPKGSLAPKPAPPRTEAMNPINATENPTQVIQTMDKTQLL